MNAAPQPRRHPWRKLLAVSASVLLGLLAGEVVVRVFAGTPIPERLPLSRIEAHPTRGWRMVPGEEHFTYQHRVRVNALGLRGAEVGPKQPGVTRVLALGDSLVYGQGVAEEDTLPVLLEAELNAAGGAFEVVNGGNRAYDTNQELRLLDELAPVIAPDVVVLFWYWNDLIERDVARSYRRLLASGPVPFDTNAPLEGEVLSSWRRKQWLRKSALLMYLWDAVGPRKPGDTPDPTRLEAGLERLGEHLDHALELAASAGFELVFSPIPDRRSLTGEHPTRALEERALAAATARGITTIELEDPLEDLVRRTGRLPVLPFDGHYGPAANRVMARAVARALLAR